MENLGVLFNFIGYPASYRPHLIEEYKESS